MGTFNERFVEAFDAEVKRRIENGEPRLTRTMVWKAAGKSSAAFTHWYGGANGMDLDTCVAVSPLLRVDPNWLFYGTGSRDLSPSIDTQTAYKGAESPAHNRDKKMHLATVSRLKPSVEFETISQFEGGGSMGHGLALPDQPGVIHNWQVSRDWIQKNVKTHTGVKNLCIVTGFGPSMQPMFNPGDPLLVDSGVKSVIADGIYFFRVGNEGFIKQLQKIPTATGVKYIAKSKNTDYDPFEITEDMDFEVLGRVVRVWCGTDF